VNLGRYEVIRELGKGAMGVVYLAKDPVIGRLVALKTIRTTGNADDDEAREFRERFVREAQAAGILSHPSIVTVHDIGEDAESGTSFIAMEYAEGKNLKEMLNSGRLMSPEELAEIIAQIAEALDYAHSKGIIHRDVKPANIILCGADRAKITDFGIAKIASGAANLTSTGQFLGTPNYMAPEQIKGGKIDGRTDIFSLGVVFYEALGRRKPFGGDSLTSISYKIVHEPFIPLSEIDSTISKAYDEIVGRCLEKLPDNRYQRASEVATSLRAAARGEKLPEPDLGADEATLMTVGPVAASRLPTVETPFPDADDATAQRTVEQETGQAATDFDTLTSKRPQPSFAIPSDLKKPIPKTVFFGIVGALVAVVAIVIGLLITGRSEIPEIDTAREAAIARQSQLRREGAQFLQRGNIEEAYTRYVELATLAPDSPEVTRILDSLESIRVARMSQQQRRESGQVKIEEGREKFEAGDYQAAIALFEEAFDLDPTSREAVNYLRMSREQLSLRGIRTSQQPASRTQRSGTAPSSTPAETTATTGKGATEGREPGTPATLLTQCRSDVRDGHIEVKLNGQTIVREDLWEDRRVAGLFRRKSPKNVAVYNQIEPGSPSIEVTVVVPSLGIQDTQTVSPSLEAGTLYRLTVTIDSASKKVSLVVS